MRDGLVLVPDMLVARLQEVRRSITDLAAPQVDEALVAEIDIDLVVALGEPRLEVAFDDVLTAIRVDQPVDVFTPTDLAVALRLAGQHVGRACRKLFSTSG